MGQWAQQHDGQAQWGCMTLGVFGEGFPKSPGMTWGFAGRWGHTEDERSVTDSVAPAENCDNLSVAD